MDLSPIRSDRYVVISNFTPSIVAGGQARMKLKRSDETRGVMIAKRICDLFNGHFSCRQHLHRRLKAAVVAKFSQCETGFSFKQMAQPRDAERATTSKIGEREG